LDWVLAQTKFEALTATKAAAKQTKATFVAYTFADTQPAKAGFVCLAAALAAANH